MRSLAPPKGRSSDSECGVRALNNVSGFLLFIKEGNFLIFACIELDQTRASGS